MLKALVAKKEKKNQMCILIRMVNCVMLHAGVVFSFIKKNRNAIMKMKEKN